MANADLQRKRAVGAVGFVGDRIVVVIYNIIAAPRRQTVVHQNTLLRIGQLGVAFDPVKDLRHGILAGSHHGQIGFLFVFVIAAQRQRRQDRACPAITQAVRKLTADSEQNGLIEKEVLDVLDIRIVLLPRTRNVEV